LDEVVKQVFDLLHPLAAASQMRLIHHLGRGPVMAAGDASLIQGAVLNLVSNAIKYGKGGTDILVACTQQENESVIAVKNQGEPIDSAHIPRLFDAHYRAPAAEHAAPGWGLGLAFVKRIAEKHGGWVAVESNTAGTTFEMHLPANPVAATPQTV
jgi:signal transduction histidine kinase